MRNSILALQKDMQSPISANRVNAGSKPSVPAPQEILDIKAAANYLGVSRSHFSHMLAGKIPGLPAIPHVRAGRRALIRRTVIDDWLLQQEHGPAVEVAR
ncbi:MAG: helix-turn-helix domain-containing protein [Bryobacteraceae bacterium]|nr:helix-turn-helix domain-containing protein [Bryobacteraceae bacterium]